jgi:predicted DNA repair protein MutK
VASPNELLQQIHAVAVEMARNAEQERIERARERERLRGVKIIRLPVNFIQGANPLTVTGETMPNPTGPDQGFVWSLKLLVVEGLTRGATPDVVQFTRNGRIIWELNGNQYAQTFGKGDQILYPGETIGIQSVGTFQNTSGKIIVHGAAWEVPGPEIGKLL